MDPPPKNTLYTHLTHLPPSVLQAVDLILNHTKGHPDEQIRLLLAKLLSLGGAPEEFRVLSPLEYYYYIRKQTILNALNMRNIPSLHGRTPAAAIHTVRKYISTQATHDMLSNFDSSQDSQEPDLECDICENSMQMGKARIRCETCSPVGDSYDICSPCVLTNLEKHVGHKVQVQISMETFDPCPPACDQCHSAISNLRYQCRDCSSTHGVARYLCSNCIVESECVSHLIVVWSCADTNDSNQEQVDHECSSCGWIHDHGIFRLRFNDETAMCPECAEQEFDCSDSDEVILNVEKARPGCEWSVNGIKCEMCASYIDSTLFFRCITCGTDLASPCYLCLACAMTAGWNLHLNHEYVVSTGAVGCDMCTRPILGARYQCRDCTQGAKKRDGNSWNLCRSCLRMAECKDHEVMAYNSSMFGQPLVPMVGACEECDQELGELHDLWHCLQCDHVEWCQSCLSKPEASSDQCKKHMAVRILADLAKDNVCNVCMKAIQEEFHVTCNTCSSYDTNAFNLCMTCVSSPAQRSHIMHQISLIARGSAGKKRDKETTATLSCSRCRNGIEGRWFQCKSCSMQNHGSSILCKVCIKESDCSDHVVLIWEHDGNSIWKRKAVKCSGCESELTPGGTFDFCLDCYVLICPSCQSDHKPIPSHKKKHQCVETTDAARPDGEEGGVSCDSCVSFIGDPVFFECLDCTDENEFSVDLCLSCLEANAQIHRDHAFFFGWR